MQQVLVLRGRSPPWRPGGRGSDQIPPAWREHGSCPRPVAQVRGLRPHSWCFRARIEPRQPGSEGLCINYAFECESQCPLPWHPGAGHSTACARLCGACALRSPAPLPPAQMCLVLHPSERNWLPVGVHHSSTGFFLGSPKVLRQRGCHPTLQGRIDDLGAGWFSLNTAPGTRPLDAPELCQSSVLSCHQNGLRSGDDKDKSRAGPASARPRRALLRPQGPHATLGTSGRLLLPRVGKDTGVQRRPDSCHAPGQRGPGAGSQASRAPLKHRPPAPASLQILPLV